MKLPSSREDGTPSTPVWLLSSPRRTVSRNEIEGQMKLPSSREDSTPLRQFALQTCADHRDCWRKIAVSLIDAVAA
jgi:hypothetical protein